MKKTFRVILTLFLIMLVFSGCQRIKETYGKKGNASASEDQAAPVFAVNTILAVKGPIQDYLALSGDIISSSTVDTYSDAAGKVSRLFVSVGSHVQRGEPVAEVDPSRPGMEFIPSLVRAPVSGTIVALPAQLGMTVNQAVPLARISGSGGLETRLFVAERFISRISLNQPCEITLDAYPGQIFRGSVNEVSPIVDAVSRTMEIRVGVENPDAKLKAGMFAKVRVITERKDDIVKVPVSALISRFGEQYVYVIDSSNSDNPIARKRILVPGIIIDGIMEVSYGLAPNEEVVMRGQTLLDDGSRVNIVERMTPLANTVGGKQE